MITCTDCDQTFNGPFALDVHRALADHASPACRQCGKPVPVDSPAGKSLCSHDCGIGDYYCRQDAEEARQRAAWNAADPATRGPYRSTVIFD